MARTTKDEKARSRSRILASAARLFRERGIEGASVGDVMKDAGLTHGGFYRHFDSKEALVQAALAEAFAQTRGPDAPGRAEPAADTAGMGFRDFYLSPRHIRSTGDGCPAAALAGDVARDSAATRQAFSAGVRALLADLAATMPGDEAARERAAARELAMLVGAVMLARATEPDLAATIAGAARTSPA